MRRVPDESPDPNPPEDPNPNPSPSPDPAGGTSTGSTDEVIGDAPGAVGPMPFHVAAEGVEAEPEQDQADASADDHEQARALLELVLASWNMMAPTMPRWWLRCQTFDDAQSRALVGIWTPYTAQYLGRVQGIWVAIATTGAIVAQNLQQAAPAERAARRGPEKGRQEPGESPPAEPEGSAFDDEAEFEEAWEEQIGVTTVGPLGT